jgi:hypothetical protein
VPSKHRESRIIAAVACPTCGVPKGQRCKEGPSSHDQRRGAEDLRPWLTRCHLARRANWEEAKRQNPGQNL